jgi:hypothetical protein
VIGLEAVMPLKPHEVTALDHLDRHGSDQVGVIDTEAKLAGAFVWNEMHKRGFVTAEPSSNGRPDLSPIAGRPCRAGAIEVHPMTGIAARLEAARAMVAMLEQQAATATCAEFGRHRMTSSGGANCGCEDGACSVPVNECSVCGVSDYGDNDDATEIRRQCNEEHSTTRLARRAGHD